MACYVYVAVVWNYIKSNHLTLKRLYGLNCRTSCTTYSEKNEWLRTSLAVKRCFGSTTNIREI